MLTALTHGGRREAEMATPTNEDWLLDKRETATAAPEGSATRMPIQRVRGCPLDTMSAVGQTPVGFHSRVKFSETKPNRKPASVSCCGSHDARTEEGTEQEAQRRAPDSHVAQFPGITRFTHVKGHFAVADLLRTIVPNVMAMTA